MDCQALMIDVEAVILVDTVPCSQTFFFLNFQTRISFNSLKSCRSIHEDFNLTKMLLKSSFKMTPLDKKSSSKILEARSLNIHGSYFRIHPTVQISCSFKFLPLWNPEWWHRWGKGSGAMTRSHQKWSGCEQNIQTGTRRYLVLFLNGERLIVMELI